MSIYVYLKYRLPINCVDLIFKYVYSNKVTPFTKFIFRIYIFPYLTYSQKRIGCDITLSGCLNCYQLGLITNQYDIVCYRHVQFINNVNYSNSDSDSSSGYDNALLIHVKTTLFDLESFINKLYIYKRNYKNKIIAYNLIKNSSLELYCKIYQSLYTLSDNNIYMIWLHFKQFLNHEFYYLIKTNKLNYIE